MAISSIFLGIVRFLSDIYARMITGPVYCSTVAVPALLTAIAEK